MKKSLVIALALMLVLAFATSAMAAQVQSGNSYLSTTETAYTLPGGGAGTTVDRVYQNTKFVADGIANYPYEIYLPNEVTPANYRIHTSYSKNTDACASCHATHTAVNGMLLQWYSAYETCMACHDGTVTSTYNVTTGEVGTAKSLAAGGMFGTGAEASLSSHNVTGTLEIAAAPGGSTVATEFDSSNNPTNWALEFGCESCHTPHGNGGNARILAPNPNGVAVSLATANGWGPASTKTGAKPTGGVGILARVYGTSDGTEFKNGIGAAIGTGKPIYYAIPNDTTEVTAESAVYNVGAAYTFLKPGRENAFSIYVNGAMQAWTTATYGPKDWYIDNSLGYTRAFYLGATPLPVGATVTFYGIPSLKVTMDIDNYLTGSEAVTHVSGMNNFCGACHTDYNTASYEVYNLNDASTAAANDGKLGGAYKFDTGKYSKAHRHSVGGARSVTDVTKQLDYEWAGGLADKVQAESMVGDKNQKKGTFTCLTCHVAHGTSYDYWNRLLVVGGKVGPSGDTWTTGEIVELAGSSALKRLPNMGTCETCHNKEAGQDGYAANSSIGANPSLTHFDATPGITSGNANATFVGSAKCEPCHAETYASYQKTAHSNMTDDISADPAAQQAWLDKLAATGEYSISGDVVTIDAPSGTVESPTTAVYTFNKSDFVLSVSWNHNTLAAVSTANGVGPDGRLYVLYEEEPFTKAEEYGCISCHNTPKNVATSNWAAFKAGIAAGTLEKGIQCETSGCHGPGSNHVASPSAKNILNPGTSSIQAQSGSNSCGNCHNSKHHQGEFWKNGTKALFTDWNNLREADADSPAWETAQQAPSPMYSGQIVSCITCHTPHSNETQDISRNGLAKTDLQLKMPVRALCNGCHENRLVTKADFDKYLPLKANGMPSHLFNGQGYPADAATMGYDPNGASFKEWRVGAE